MKLRFLIIVPALLLLATVCACGRREKPFVDNRVPRDLNQVLTNEMSDFEQLAGLDERVMDYLRKWNIRGAQLCIMRGDSLLYAKGYGWADKEKEEKMTPRTIMRVASVSKLLTATGIMVLEERGKLSLGDKVFGPEGILSDSLFTAAIKDTNCLKITVEDLLRHESGFTSTLGDPMFSTRTIMRNNNLRTPPDHRKLVGIILRRPLAHVPGTEAEYSNFGYLLASMVIEKVTGEDYETWMQENVLKEAHCNDFHIAGNYYGDKYPTEARYYLPSNEKPVSEYNNSGRTVTRCYGGNDIRALSGAGAWVASAPELARFVASIDIRKSVRDIIGRESIHRMVEYFDEDTYALGWNDTDPQKGWKRTGSFSGTSALIHYFPDGECWIFLCNTSTWKGARQARETGELFVELRSEFSDLLPDQDLFFYPDITSDEGEASVKSGKKDGGKGGNKKKTKADGPVKEEHYEYPDTKKDDLEDISRTAEETLTSPKEATTTAAPTSPVKRNGKNAVNDIPPTAGVKVPTVLFPSK